MIGPFIVKLRGELKKDSLSLLITPLIPQERRHRFFFKDFWAFHRFKRNDWHVGLMDTRWRGAFFRPFHQEDKWKNQNHHHRKKIETVVEGKHGCLS